MFANSLSTKTKPVLQIMTPGPDLQTLNADELGITAHLKAVC
jgi:hypothetical protein